MISCNATSNGANVQPSIINGCCPVCPNPCDGVVCPAIFCPIGFKYVIAKGDCCGSCVPQTNCSFINCTPIDTCPLGTIKVRGDCCDICQPVLPCANVKCALDNLICPDGKIVFNDGECCPVCQPRPICNFACPNITSCPLGTNATKDDLGCCLYCRPIDYCIGVTCSIPNCVQEKWIKRDGMCCPQCPLCTDSSNQLCNPNDDSECKAGFFMGPNCNNTIPPSNRTEKVITVRFCKLNCTILDPQTIRILVSVITGLDSKYITVTILPGADGCCRFQIIITAQINDLDINQASSQVILALSSSPDWTVEQGATSSNNMETNTPSTIIKSESSILTVSTLLATAVLAFSL